MSKKFFFMLKRMGKKGAFGRRFLETHAHKPEEELRKEVFKELDKTLKREVKERRLEKFRDQLNKHPDYKDFRRSRHYEKIMDVTGSALNNIRGVEEVSEEEIRRRGLARKTENIEDAKFKEIEEKEDELKRLSLQIYTALREKVGLEKIGEEIRRQKTEDKTWRDAARAANNNIIRELRDQLKAEKEREEEHERRDNIEKGGGKKDTGSGPPNIIVKTVTEKVGGFSSAFFIVAISYLIFWLDRWMRFDGLDINTVLSRLGESSLWYRIFFNVFVITALVWYFITQWMDKKDPLDFLSYAVLIFFTSFIISFGALNWGLYHLVIVYTIYVAYITPIAEEKGWSKRNARLYMVALLFIDYFGFGIAKKYFGFEQLGNRYIFPIWSYVLLYLKLKSRRHWFSTLAFMVLILLSLYPVAADIYMASAGKVATQQQLGEAGAFWEEGRQKLEDNIKMLYTNVKKGYQKQLEYATGGYYEGQVEENENIPLGVYFEDLRTSVGQFYEDEPIEVWGNLLVRTLDRDTPVTVSVGCEYKDENIPGDVKPRESFTIYTLEEEAIECRFGAGAIPTGTKKISLDANFNFKTMAYLKSYMIDKETLRSLRRDNVDVFKHFEIKDKSPIAIFTNGPVKIGMETNELPIGIDEQATPYLGITIDNQWSGNIHDIREMIVQIPKGMKFFDNCDQKFDEVETGGVADPDYHTYVLNERGRRYLKMPIKIDEINYRSLRCLMQIYDKSKLLGDVPFITKYFRTTISYDYELIQEINVNIMQSPAVTYYVKGGICDIGNNYEFISNSIDNSEIKNCKQYLGNFSEHQNNMANKDKIDLLMVLAIAQKESSCNPDVNNGIMQVEGLGKDHSVAEQIGVGVNMLDDAFYNAVRKENEEKNYKFNDLDLLKFVLLGYNRGLSAAKEAMKNYRGGVSLYDAMKYGCETFYEGKTDSSGYSLCTGKKEGSNNIRAYGAAYPDAVFDIYKKACKDMGGSYDEEAIA